MAKRYKTVTMERFAYEKNEMLLRVSGGGIAGGGDGLYGDLIMLDGVDDVILTRWYVCIYKDDDADWSTIVPAIKKAITDFFGNDVRIIERTQDSMPDDIGMMLGEANLDSMRNAMRGCALTEEESEALGFGPRPHFPEW